MGRWQVLTAGATARVNRGRPHNLIDGNLLPDPSPPVPGPVPPMSVLAAGRDEGLDTRVELQPLRVHLLHVGHRHAREQGHTLAQAFLVVGDLAAHRRLGDGGDAVLDADLGGEFVDAFLPDHGRIHVGDQKPLAPVRVGKDGDVDRLVLDELADRGAFRG